MTVNPVDESESFAPPKPVSSERVSKEDSFDRKVVGEEEVVVEEVASEPTVTELTDEERTWLRTLMTVGRRERVISVLDHKVHIQTLKAADELRIGLYTKPFQGTNFFGRAHQVGYCAAGIKYIDGKPIVPASLSENPDPSSVFNDKVKAVEEHYPLVITIAYEAITDLEKEFVDLMIKLGKLKG